MSDFSIIEPSDMRNFHVYGGEIRNRLNTYTPISVKRPSQIQLIAAHHQRLVHCGLIVENNFQVGDKTYQFCLLHLLPNVQQSKIKLHFRNNKDELKKILWQVLTKSPDNPAYFETSFEISAEPIFKIKDFAEKILGKEFVLKHTNENQQDYIKGVNCLKFVDYFSEILKYEVPKEFQNSVKQVLANGRLGESSAIIYRLAVQRNY